VFSVSNQNICKMMFFILCYFALRPSGTTVELVIGEPIIAPEASYGLTLLGNELKSRMRGHGIAQAL
jgi:hypothetical protein